MGTPCLKHFFTKAFRNSIFAFSILVFSFTVSLAQDGEKSILLPPLTNDADKLAALIQIKEKVPNLFSDAAQYDIDLFALLEDEEKLLDHLKSNPKYVELFKHKKYHEIQIIPPQKGLQIGDLIIDPMAVKEWKEQLKNKLNQLKTKQIIVNGSSTPLEALNREINFKVISLPPKTTSSDGNALLKELEMIKENQKPSNDARKQRKANTLTARLLTSLEIYDQLKEPSPNFKEKLQQALKIEQNREDLKSLLELHSVIDRSGQNIDPSHLTWERVKDSLNALGSQDLVFLQGTNYLSTAVDRLISSSRMDIKEEMLNRIKKNISSFATRTIRSEKKATEPVTISQQHPIVGIFRGCTGGDCSSQYSFPYPNDPNEKVFFILDKDKKVKGYVNATQVMANGKPSLYVITVSGNRVTPADTELIFRGLEKEKATLGVEQILLPTSSNAQDLINFHDLRSVYTRYSDNQTSVPIDYQDPEIRNDIQNYESTRGYNRGNYDHMDHNTQAVVLSFKKNSENQEVTTHTHELPTTSLQVPPLNSTPMSEVIEFLLDLKRSGRQELEKRVLQIEHVRESLDLEKYHDLTKLLSEGPSEKSIKVAKFKELLKNKLVELNGSLGGYMDKKPDLIYPAMLSCFDAFSPENIDETAKYILKHIKESNGDLFPKDSKWHKIIEDNLTHLNNSDRVKKFNQDLLTHLQNTDPSMRRDALFKLKKIKPNDPNIHSTILHVALEDSDKQVRYSALTTLESLNPSDGNIHTQISQIALHDSDLDMRRRALYSLESIKPSDPKISAEISTVLNDPDEGVRMNALMALGNMNPQEPKIHLKISRLASQDLNSDVRMNALIVLSKLKPSNPDIHSEISQVALHHTELRTRAQALVTLGEMRPTDPRIHLEISNLLQDPDEKIRKHALYALHTIKPNESDIHLKISELAAQDVSSELKRYALDILSEINPTDPRVHLQISHALHDSDLDVRKRALIFFEKIKPSDPRIHLEISHALQDSDLEIRKRALLILGTVMPSNPKIHLEISNALSDSDKGVRMNALFALANIKPQEPNIHLKMSEIATQDLNFEVKMNALVALTMIQPTDPRVHLEISRALQDSNNEVRKTSLYLLHQAQIINDPEIHAQISQVALHDSGLGNRMNALALLAKFKPTDRKVHSEISNLLRDSNTDIKMTALKVLAAINPKDPKIHLEILKIALHDRNQDFREMALRVLGILKSSHPEVNKGLLQIAIHHDDLRERALAIQALEDTDLSNRSTREVLKADLLKNLNQLKDRQDLLFILHKVMLPASVGSTHCESLNTILSHHKNLESLIELFSNDSGGVLKGLRTFPRKTGENADLPPVPPSTRNTHVNPPVAPGW